MSFLHPFGICPLLFPGIRVGKEIVPPLLSHPPPHVSSIRYSVERTIQRGRTHRQPFGCRFLPASKYCKVHLSRFSLSLGVFWDFPIVARNRSLLVLFG